MPFLLFLLLLPQAYSQRGFVETRATLYPESASNDAAHAVGEALLRHESFLALSQRLQLAGTVELRTDSHHQTERRFRMTILDRTRQRPLFAVRRLTAQYRRAGLTVEAGKQLIRWGKTDILNPTDRFAPRDFLTVVDSEFLGVTALRGTLEKSSETIDVIWTPNFTPSRLPLPNQRWMAAPPGVPSFPVVRFLPEGSQTGIRWSHIGFVEFAAAFYSGFDHLPAFELDATQTGIRQFYPGLKMAGGDVAFPLPWVTVKAEGAHFSFSDERVDDYVTYVVQLERQTGEWFLVWGYGGEAITAEGTQDADFNPDRGRIRTLLGRAGYTIDTNRSVTVEGAVRQDGNGLWLKSEYSHAIGQHWRATGGFVLIRGNPSDFIGQFRKNSHAFIALRYSY
jgi:hypothetical protein